MRAANWNAPPPRRRRARWGLGRWLILALAALSFAALSGCAGLPKAPPAATPPRIALSQQQRTGEACEDQLRGRLPLADELTVGESLAQWVEAEARAACWRAGYLELVGITETANVAWERYANDRRRH